MGIDNAHIFNHNLQYSNAAQLIAQIENRLGLPVFNDIFNEDDTKLVKVPDGFNGLIMTSDNGLTVDDYFKNGELMEFDRMSPDNDSGHFYINPFVIENSLPQVYLRRWWDTKEMCDLIREYGLRTFAAYDADNITNYVGYDGGCYVLKDRVAIQPHIQKWGSTNMLTFCSDYHDEYIEHIEQNWSFNDFISWGKKEFIYVDFKDLPLFVFPKEKPDCYNVFIYDDFADIFADTKLKNYRA